MQQLSKPCAHCGKVFYKKPANSMKAWTDQIKYCSRECYWKDKNQPPKKVCPTCGQKFKPKDWRTAAIYCSRECVAKAQSQKRTMPRAACLVCGRPVNKARAKFCSPECRKIGYKSDKVYNYRGPDCIDFYTSTFWYALADEIRQRDKVCQHCGKTPEQNGKALDVHHIVPRSIREDHSHSNLVALCVSCHAKADAKDRVKRK